MVRQGTNASVRSLVIFFLETWTEIFDPHLCPDEIHRGKHITIRIYPITRRGFAVQERLIHSGYYTYMERNIGRGWRQFLKTQDSLTILIYIEDLDKFVLVRQPREALITYENPEGMVTECVAGRFDKSVTPMELAILEAKQEAGITLYEADIELLNKGKSMPVSPGSTTERAYLAYAIVTSERMGSDQQQFSAEDEDERITRLLVDPGDLMEQGCEDLRVFTLLQYHIHEMDL